MNIEPRLWFILNDDGDLAIYEDWSFVQSVMRRVDELKTERDEHAQKKESAP